MEQPRAILVDSETTGLDEPDVIELTHSRPFKWGEDLASYTAIGREADFETLRFKPGKPITCGAKAAHHIVEKDLVQCAVWPGSWHLNADYLIGHNIDFDWQALGSQGTVKRICTLALARVFYEDTDSHTLGALMYYLYGDDDARELARLAHTTDGDLEMTRLLLKELIHDSQTPLTSFEDLWQLSEDARIPRRLTFGKHGPKDGKPGLLYSEVPIDYLDWMVRQDMETYVLMAAKRELQARGRGN